MRRRHEEFYVGYAARAPAGLGRFLRVLVVRMAAGVVLVFLILALGQEPQPSGVFEFGVTRRLEGVLYQTPLPLLRVATGPGGAEGTPVVNLLLTGAGKRGLPDFAAGSHGRRVRFRGSLVYRENTAMVELNDPGSFEVLGEPLPGQRRGAVEIVGPVTLSGELVDTKCFLGVMRPAAGKVHRGCAVRCLSGGVPPGLLVPGDAGGGRVFVLAGAADGPLRFDPQWAGRIVTARGRLELHDDLPLLRVEELRLLRR